MKMSQRVAFSTAGVGDPFEANVGFPNFILAKCARLDETESVPLMKLYLVKWFARTHDEDHTV